MGIGEIGVAVGIVAALLAGMRWIVASEIIHWGQAIVTKQAELGTQMRNMCADMDECKQDRRVIHTTLDDHGNRIIVLEERVR